MKVFFISDLHLNEKAINSYKLFVKFCENLPLDTQSVYILGDLFEFWIDDNWNTKFLIRVKKTLQELTKKCKVYFIAGNRDFLIGEKFAQETEIIILPNIFYLNLFGYRTLLMHGDLLSSSDRLHFYFTKIIRHPITISIAHILPIKLKLILAKILRILSQKKHLKKKTIYNNTIKDDICISSVNTLMKKYSVELLIHGHTHKPNIYNYNKIFTRIVLSDWDHQATILEFTPHGYQLKTISN